MQDPAELDHTSPSAVVSSDCRSSSVVYCVHVPLGNLVLLSEQDVWLQQAWNHRTSKKEWQCHCDSLDCNWHLCWCLSHWVVFLDVVSVLWQWLTHKVLVYSDGIMMNVQRISDGCFVTCWIKVIVSWFWIPFPCLLYPVSVCFNFPGYSSYDMSSVCSRHQFTSVTWQRAPCLLHLRLLNRGCSGLLSWYSNKRQTK